MATAKIDKYADFRYEIGHPDELSEVEWMIGQGIYKNVEDYTNTMTKMQISIMRDADIKKKKTAEKRRLAMAKRKMAA